MNDQGELTHAAILLFGKDPTRHFVTAKFKIGKFGNSSNPNHLFGQASKIGRLSFFQLVEMLQGRFYSIVGRLSLNRK
jgi:predicted HTH transcriptional regulator